MPYIVLTHQFHSLISPGDLSTLEILVTSTFQTTYVWTVDLPKNTSFSAAVKDTTSANDFTSLLKVNPNPSGETTCTGNTTAGHTPYPTHTPTLLTFYPRFPPLGRPVEPSQAHA
jgi:hypothetical protein